MVQNSKQSQRAVVN